MIKKDKFVESYIKNKTLSATCRELNIARSTAYRYLEDKEILQEIDNIRRESHIDLVEYLRSESLNASKTLVDIINNEKTPASVKVQAINLLFISLREFENRTEYDEKIEEIMKTLSKLSN